VNMRVWWSFHQRLFTSFCYPQNALHL
jgi:hypothetical protein